MESGGRMVCIESILLLLKAEPMDTHPFLSSCSEEGSECDDS